MAVPPIVSRLSSLIHDDVMVSTEAVRQEVIDEGAIQTANAAAEADRAETSANFAEEFSGPAYANQAAGEAATTTGQFFRVWNGDTPRTYTRYERTAGGSSVAAPLATTADLVSNSGAMLVGTPTGSVDARLNATDFNLSTDNGLNARTFGKMTGDGDETAKFSDLIAYAANRGYKKIFVPLPIDADYYTVGEVQIPDGLSIEGTCPPPREAFTLSMLAGYSAFVAPNGAAVSMSFGDEVKLSKLVLYGSDAATGANGKTRDGFVASASNASSDIRRSWIEQCGFFMFRDAIGRASSNPNGIQYVRTTNIVNTIISNCTRGISNVIDAQVLGGLVSAFDDIGVNQETGSNNAFFGAGFTCSDSTKVLAGAFNAAVGMKFSTAINQIMQGVTLDSNSGNSIQVLSGAGVQIIGGLIKRSGTADMHHRDLYQDINASGFDYLMIDNLRTLAGLPDNQTAYRRLPFTSFTGTTPVAGNTVTAPGGKSGTVFSFFNSAGTGSVVLTGVTGAFASSDALTFSTGGTATASAADAAPNTPGQSILVSGTGSGRFTAINVDARPRGGTGNRIIVNNSGSFGSGYRIIACRDVADI